MKRQEQLDGQANDRLVTALWRWKRIESPHWTGEVEVTSVKAKLPDNDALEVLVVITGLASDGTPVVGFHNAVGLLEALGGAAGRIANGKMKWRVDEYRAGTNQGSD